MAIKALSQKPQGPPFQAPMSMKWLDPECGGCTILWLEHLHMVNIIFYIKRKQGQFATPLTFLSLGSSPFAQQMEMIGPLSNRALAIARSSGKNCTTQHRQFSGRSY